MNFNNTSSAGPSGMGMLLLECSESLTVDSPSTSNFHEQQQKAAAAATFMAARNSRVLQHLQQQPHQSTPDRILNSNWRSSIYNQIDRNIQLDVRSLINLMELEEYYQPNYHYFTAVQEHITAYHREQAIDWICDVAKEERCDGDVLLQAVSIIDRFLSCQNIFKHDIQMLAGVALFIASKLKMAHPLNATKIAYYSDDSLRIDDVLSWELLVVNQLQWETESPTAFDFFDQLTARLPTISMIRDQFQDTVHRCQKMHKLATLFPSMQCAIVLYYLAGVPTTCEPTFGALLRQLIAETFQLHSNLLDSYVPMIQKCLSGTQIYAPPENPTPPMFAPTTSIDDDTTPSPLNMVQQPPPPPPVMMMMTAMKMPMTPHNNNNNNIDSGFSSDVSSPSESAEKKRKHAFDTDDSPPKMLRIV